MYEFIPSATDATHYFRSRVEYIEQRRSGNEVLSCINDNAFGKRVGDVDSDSITDLEIIIAGAPQLMRADFYPCRNSRAASAA